MREINIFQYYRIGYNYYLLRFQSLGISVHEGEFCLVKKIDELFNLLDELDLQVTRTAAVDLENIAERVKKLPKDSKVDETLAKEVEEAIDKFDATLDAELQLRSAYMVTPKRFHLDNLLKFPVRLFASKVFRQLPPICRYDFAYACRCIAFGLPTAAAFHLMRGTEGVLRHYYCSIVKRKRVPKFLWNNIVEHLRKRREAPPKPLLDNLDNIRDNFRNPTQHPDARYDMDEAQDLLSISIEVVNRMLRDLSSRAKP